VKKKIIKQQEGRTGNNTHEVTEKLVEEPRTYEKHSQLHEEIN
jgi:hypothetical protein